MRDQLVGYVLGALDSVEREQLKQQLHENKRLQGDVAVLQKAVKPLSDDHGHFAPPIGLAQRTCELIDSHRLAPARTHAAVTPEIDSTMFESPRPPSGRWNLLDMAVAAGIVLAAALLIIPGINHSRFNARVAACQNNLAEIGLALKQYSTTSPDGTLPAIPQDGRLSVAGVYAPMLMQAELVTDPRIFFCASEAGCDAENTKIPAYHELVQLDEAGDSRLEDMLNWVGGSYAYNLGYVQDNVYRTVSLKNSSRPTFVLMADRACPELKFSQSSNHGGHGQNVLFEDLHVNYVSTCHSPGCGDEDFFHNDDGEIAAGNHADDAVVGHSSVRPLK